MANMGERERASLSLNSLNMLVSKSKRSEAKSGSGGLGAPRKAY